MIAGFTSAAAITIASSQIKSLLGLLITERSHVLGIAGTWWDVINNLHTIRVADTVLGTTCIIILLILRVCGIDTYKQGRMCSRSFNIFSE